MLDEIKYCQEQAKARHEAARKSAQRALEDVQTATRRLSDHLKSDCFSAGGEELRAATVRLGKALAEIDATRLACEDLQRLVWRVEREGR